MTASRRNACPTLTNPMQTGDGLLARLPVATGPYSLAAIRAIAGAALAFGNGLVEVSARGSIQIRGLRRDTIDGLVVAMDDIGLAGGAGPQVATPPLAGLDPAEAMDVHDIAQRIRARIAGAGFAGRLAPKVSVVIDGGGSLHLDALSADLRFTADDGALLVAVGGDAATAEPLGSVAAEDAPAVAVALLGLIAGLGPTARGRDLASCGAKDLRSVLGASIRDGAPLPLRPTAVPVGRHRLKSGAFAVGLGVAFGQMEAEALTNLADAAATSAATSMVPAPGRALIAIGIPASALGSFEEAAARLGFVTRADDPRLRVFACAGSPACASGLQPARAMAPAVAKAAAPLLREGVTLHVSGCAKGCALPGPATLTLVGMPGGYGLIRKGRPSDLPADTIPSGKLIAAIGDLARDGIGPAMRGEMEAADG